MNLWNFKKIFSIILLQLIILTFLAKLSYSQNQNNEKRFGVYFLYNNTSQLVFTDKSINNIISDFLYYLENTSKDNKILLLNKILKDELNFHFKKDSLADNRWQDRIIYQIEAKACKYSDYLIVFNINEKGGKVSFEIYELKTRNEESKISNAKFRYYTRDFIDIIKIDKKNFLDNIVNIVRILLNEKLFYSCKKCNEYNERNDFSNNRFVDNGDGTITDRKTKLTWSAHDYEFHWFENVKSYLADFQLGDRIEWRVPSYSEMNTLFVKSEKCSTLHTCHNNVIFLNPQFHPYSSIFTCFDNEKVSLANYDFSNGVLEYFNTQDLHDGKIYSVFFLFVSSPTDQDGGSH